MITACTIKLTSAGLMLPRNGMKQEELCDVAIALGQVYPFIRKSECHRSAMLSVNIAMSKSQMLGKKLAQNISHNYIMTQRHFIQLICIHI
jgi:hypothetical protein